MITLTAQIKLDKENEYPFILGSSYLGNDRGYDPSFLGQKIDAEIGLGVSQITSIGCERIKKQDNNLPSYGIRAGNGQISFKDFKNGIFRDFFSRGFLREGAKAKIFLNETIKKNKQQVAEYIVSKWEYDVENKTFSISLKDDIEDWQDIQVDAVNYNPKNAYEVFEGGRMSSVYKYLHSKTPTKYKMLDYESLDEKTKGVLNNTRILYPYLEMGSLWAQWQKLCTACMLYIYKGAFGETKCVYGVS